MTSELTYQVCLLFASLFLVGSLACLPLFHWRVDAFVHSRLWIKIYWWLPIFAGFLAIVWTGVWLAWIACASLLAQAGREWRSRRAWRRWIAWSYLLVFSLGLLHLPLLMRWLGPRQRVIALISICFASVLSDVVAFFAGSYFGKHALPAWINDRKSWEGVAGQLLGAGLGLGLVATLPAISFSWPLALGIGLASAVGDLYNSTVKRTLRLKDWSQAIPGHGGVLDRFSSLSLALAAGFWILR